MRYYSTLRPISIGCFPHGHEVTEICNFQKREFVKKIGRNVWGFIEFADNLTEKEADQYDLIPEDTEKPGKGKYTYLCWFDSEEEADNFIKEVIS